MEPAATPTLVKPMAPRTTGAPTKALTPATAVAIIIISEKIVSKFKTILLHVPV